MERMYYLRNDKTGEITSTDDIEEWGRRFDSMSRNVIRTTIGEISVSTVFLGLDHRYIGSGAPILFETMVFDGPLDGEQERYETESEARHGHLMMLARVLDALEGKDDGNEYK